MPDEEPAIPLEAALEQLEQLVVTLEDGELPLEEALRVFEQGVALTRNCAARLREVEQRVEVLLSSGDGAERVPFAEPEEFGDEDSAL
ncbi:MAG: exodeoxyribonuclease VII small subunit [Myxococcales bacterium]|nr:exodeoxyribonuclease VII small subunit [Myxococcales bacterium]